MGMYLYTSIYQSTGKYCNGCLFGDGFYNKQTMLVFCCWTQTLCSPKVIKYGWINRKLFSMIIFQGSKNIFWFRLVIFVIFIIIFFIFFAFFILYRVAGNSCLPHSPNICIYFPSFSILNTVDRLRICSTSFNGTI